MVCRLGKQKATQTLICAFLESALRLVENALVCGSGCGGRGIKCYVYTLFLKFDVFILLSLVYAMCSALLVKYQAREMTTFIIIMQQLRPFFYQSLTCKVVCRWSLNHSPVRWSAGHAAALVGRLCRRFHAAQSRTCSGRCNLPTASGQSSCQRSLCSAPLVGLRS